MDLQIISKKASKKSKTVNCSEICRLCNFEKFIFHESWKKIISFHKSKLQKISARLHQSEEFFPPIQQIFEFTKYVTFDQIKVVIIGQDPYHNEGLAMGLAFSINPGSKMPPTVKNIIKELKNDIGNSMFDEVRNGNLIPWTRQGVLLLNTVLTVERNKPGSHRKIGWESLTDTIITQISTRLNNIVFIMWGECAKQKAEFIDSKKHLLLHSAHPNSFEPAQFFGKNHFSKTNDYLIKNKKTKIFW